MNGYRDLNKNGRLDPYEDSSRPVDERVEDLLGQMTLPEKAGLMFQPIVFIGDVPGALTGEQLLSNFAITHMNIFGGAQPSDIASWSNRVQAAAEATRLGIPVTVSTDPRHAYTSNPGTGSATAGFSQWPEAIGLGATGDPKLVRTFAEIARQEYAAVGIRLALSPMADIATEPRWARAHGTFGEDVALVSAMTAEYIRGFQGEELGPESVACMVKHFPGGGPQKDGEDSHFPYGREQVYPGGRFEEHLVPFEKAFAAGVAQVMPYYSMPIGIGLEEVGFAFNRAVITGMIRERFGFDGVICADWGVLNDSNRFGKHLPARAWGVEHLDVLSRAEKALEAGVDQFGGESCPGVIVALVEAGRVSEARIDESIRRLLRDKFRLGLFDNPYVDEVRAAEIAGCEAFREAGELAQRKSIVLLKAGLAGASPTVPLTGGVKVYLEGVEPTIASEYATVVSTIEEADVAILRVKAPFEPRDEYFLESFMHAGSLAYDDATLDRLLGIATRIPTIVDVTLDRAAVIPELARACAGLLVSFGASDAALLDVIFGRFAPVARLPFELPSSMEAVRAQLPDVPADSKSPLFPLGFGLTY